MTLVETQTAVQPILDPSTRLGHVHYTVADLQKQIAFYRDILGFRVHWQTDNSAALGAGREDLLRLTEVPGARASRGTTGLYHTAFLVPSRRELAQLLKRIALSRTPIQGLSNHGTHHAIYLPDAEGNGIELAWDLPKEKWPKTFEEMMANNRGLPVEEIFGVLSGDNSAWTGLAPETQIGHVHLHVADLPATMRFYRDLLGFGLPMDMANAPREFAESAIFFAAGDYHHHIGTNVWQGVGAPRPPADATGLRYFTVVLPDDEQLEELIERVEQDGIAVEQMGNAVLVRDPAGNGVVLTSEELPR